MSTIDIKLSAASARLAFNGCDPKFIRDICHAACCRSTTSPTGTMVAVTKEETPKIKAYGAKVLYGLIVPVTKRCPFQHQQTNLCNLHHTPDKPSGCIASPFMLNKKDTLVIRHRYIMLKCYNAGKKLPAYKAFYQALILLLGKKEAARIRRHLNRGGGDLIVKMNTLHYFMMKQNTKTRANVIA